MGTYMDTVHGVAESNRTQQLNHQGILQEVLSSSMKLDTELHRKLQRITQKSQRIPETHKTNETATHIWEQTTWLAQDGSINSILAVRTRQLDDSTHTELQDITQIKEKEKMRCRRIKEHHNFNIQQQVSYEAKI